MMRIAIVGCGIVGAAIAYELSRVSGFEITVFETENPASGSTGAALGVLMGAISQKKPKSRAWKLREASLRRYETLIPELEAKLDRPIPRNDNGVLKLCFPGENLEKWEKLAQVRREQGFPLEIWSPEAVKSRYPKIETAAIAAAVYSPQDRQIQPIPLARALVEAARGHGVRFVFGATVMEAEIETGETRCCRTLIYKDANDETRQHSTDWVVVSAGLGSTPFSQRLREPVTIQPVLGQAIELAIALPSEYPVVTANDVHLVSVGEGRAWVGATVEFPDAKGYVIPDPRGLQMLKSEAMRFYPELVEAAIARQWQGLRPRPVDRSAPVIGTLPGYDNVVLATGHYRNGVLLAPATAEAVCMLLLNNHSAI
ncbi:NAD(P)/FAD-dependent oxidoreductase [Baaleninema simplex]|uniref:NAD(P)/FAD-dependent oxidoreductase n=1 Tax=Baaleninema simplex TaxID=2862350 RepID=UPI00192C3959|nr:FAD-dependent oxidoreductase [Baaleninema simplex]